MDWQAEFLKWKNDSIFDDATRKEVSELQDEEEIKDRFYKQLSFGTGGLRGIIGAGTNRMNIYTVGKATQGLANFIRSQTTEGSVAIAYDSRNMSAEFALDSALVLCANGIRVYLFESLRPTPELSYAVRALHATAGIVITASHNPPQYNGYKVYWSDGGQIVPPYDKLIIDEVNRITDFGCIRKISKENALKAGLLSFIGKEIDDSYIAELKKLSLNPEIIRKNARDIRIVYTPLNGTGNMPVCRILQELGFCNVWVVPEQAQPDGNFPTLEYPNPEDPKAFSYALALAKEKNADLVLATDPDADRLGIYAKDTKTGEYVPFTGNMSGLLIAEYLLSQRAQKGLLPERRKDGAIVTTIVSSKMAYEIAKAYGLSVIEVLTGFKYIGEQIKLFEQARDLNDGKTDYTKSAYEYEFGYEESYGCLAGTHARDKDAVMAVAALCEAAAYYKDQGLTLWDQMLNLYKKYGYYKEELTTFTLRGADGAVKIHDLMEKLRSDYPATLGGYKVIAVRDYEKGIRTLLSDGTHEKTSLPKSNVLYFEIEQNGWCCVRPSGTEPKIKFYFGVKGNTLREAEMKVSHLKESLLKLANQ